jgi:rare lipoprotein A (peptidoglycan hydrolase)
MATLALVVTAVLPLSACAHHYRFPPAPAPSVGLVEVGIASWYGPGYDG